MRVLHVIPSLAQEDGGPTRAMLSIEEALVAQGVEVVTATTTGNRAGEVNRGSGEDGVREGLVTRHYFARACEFYKPAPGFASWMERRVREFDLVHVHALFSFTSVIAARAARRNRVPYVLRPLGTLARYGLSQRQPLLKSLSLRFIEGPILRDAAAVHFTSEAERDEALALGIPMRPVVIPLGVHLDAGVGTSGAPPWPEATPGQVRLLYLSRLDPKKNVEGLLRALALLRREDRRPALFMAGSGAAAYVDRLVALASELGVQDQVHWLGFVAGERKARLLASTDVFVLPSHSENFGIAVAEALAAGLPSVVGRGVAIAPQIVAAGAGVAVDSDAESIAAGLRHYLGSSEARSTAGASAAELVRREFSLERMGRRLVDLYESIRVRPKP